MLLVSAMAASAQTYDLSWHKIAGGGGMSSGGTYSVSGTIGQPDAGQMSGGTYSIAGGFWGIYAVVQTPGAPFLIIVPSGSNVQLLWPVSATGFNLQTNSNLATSNWGPVSQTTNVVSGTNIVTVPSTQGDLFFRLKYP
jgi:hypothetical protein